MASAVLLDDNLLGLIFEPLGLRCVLLVSATCSIWADAAANKAEEWSILLEEGSTIGRGRGCAPGQFQRPTFIAALPEGGLCVSDSHNHRLVLLRRDGEVGALIGDGGDGLGEFLFPMGVACDGKVVFVADSNNCRLQALQLDGTALCESGNYGHGEGQLFRPQGVALAGDALFVSDTDNNRIVRYDKKLRVQASFGSRGAGRAQFNSPRGIAADEEELFVADSANHRVSVLAHGGAPLRNFGGYGKAPGQFMFPSDVCLGRSRVFVVEPKRRVQVLTREGLPLQVFVLWEARGDLCAISLSAHVAVVSDCQRLHVLRLGAL